jgi:hypothetical protein
LEETIVSTPKKEATKTSILLLITSMPTTTTDGGSSDDNNDKSASSSNDQKERRKELIAKELNQIFKGADEYVQEYLEEDEFEAEAITALTKAANEMAYLKKYYNVMKDEMILFPSVPKLIMTNSLQEGAEKYYWEEDDEFPMEYSKCLKTIVREQGYKEDEDGNGDNDAYMEKLAQDVEI